MLPRTRRMITRYVRVIYLICVRMAYTRRVFKEAGSRYQLNVFTRGHILKQLEGGFQPKAIAAKVHKTD